MLNIIDFTANYAFRNTNKILLFSVKEINLKVDQKLW
jgi:hypothetical protein